MLREIAPLGIGPYQRFDADRFDAEQAGAIEEGINAAKDFLVTVQGARGAVVEGWTYPNARTGDFAQDYLLRAVINPIAAIAAMGMLLEHSGQEAAGRQVIEAIKHVTGTQMESQAAGRMGHSTTEVGDLVCEAL